VVKRLLKLPQLKPLLPKHRLLKHRLLLKPLQLKRLLPKHRLPKKLLLLKPQQLLSKQYCL